MTPIHADDAAREKKAELRAGFMRAYVLAEVRSGHSYEDNNDLSKVKAWAEFIALEARIAWDAIEEAAK